MILLLDFYFLLFLLINYQSIIIQKHFKIHKFINVCFYLNTHYAKYINYLFINL
jgi:hypothetical protein